MSTKPYSLNGFLLVAPIIVLLLTKFCIYYSITCFRSEISWIPSFIGYYIAICLMFFIASRYLGLPLKNIFRRSLKPVPTVGIFFLGIILPALLPLGVFILHIKQVPASYFGFIVLFSCINPIFEEGFWRGLLNYLPGNKVFRIFYSAFLFGFSHYFLWGYWFKTPMVIVPTV